MRCAYPLKAYKHPEGGITFKPAGAYIDRPLELPCGQCMKCRIVRQQSWAIRAMHEAQTHEKSCFLTLTYDDDHLPAGYTLRKEDWKCFARDVRYHFGPFRYLHCGEYGDETLRPHYHACVFGLDFIDEDKRSLAGDGYTNLKLQDIWGRGFVHLGEVNYQTANYVAGYTLKKLNGEKAEEKYSRPWGQVAPEYATMSLKPGLGTAWLHKYWKDVYPSDFIIANGRKFKPPKFYDTWCENNQPQVWERVKAARLKTANDPDFQARNSPERKEDSDAIARARLNLKRNTL